MAYQTYAEASLAYRANEPLTWYGDPFVLKCWRAACEKPAMIAMRHEKDGEVVEAYSLTAEQAINLARSLLGAANYLLGGQP